MLNIFFLMTQISLLSTVMTNSKESKNPMIVLHDSNNFIAGKVRFMRIDVVTISSPAQQSFIKRFEMVNWLNELRVNFFQIFE